MFLKSSDFYVKIVRSGLWNRSVRESHCKDTIPKIRNKYSQKRNCAVTVPILPILLQENMWTDSGNIYSKSLTDTWRGKWGLRPPHPFAGNTKYINRIFVAIWIWNDFWDPDPTRLKSSGFGHTKLTLFTNLLYNGLTFATWSLFSITRDQKRETCRYINSLCCPEGFS